MRYGHARGPLAIAHRGGAGLAAENTLPAFRRSYALGVRHLETDLRVSADGALVAFHDATLGRVTHDRGRVRMRCVDELCRMPVVGGGTIVDFAELLITFPDAAFAVDVKTAAAVAPLARLLVDTGAAGRVCVAGARGSWLRRLRDLVGTELVTALSWRATVRLVRCRGEVPVEDGCDYVHVPLRLGPVPVVDRDLLVQAHDAGLRVVVWTVNNVTTMRRLLDLGVDGIITDRPDLLRDLLIARGEWTVPGDHSRSSGPLGGVH